MRLVKKRPSRALLAAAPALPFRVEAIRGRYEYVQHSAWIDGDPIVVVTGRQDMGDDLVIKRGSVTYERCDDVDFGAIFRALKYTGFACVDFKIKDGQPKIFEINPRLGGSLVLGPDLDPVMGAVAKKLGL
jgi:predicted ATP-grasp superfamily ATP-dependent carboligase